MVKKILGIFILLILIIFFSIYVVVDNILIKKTITNIEKKLNSNIYLHEDYSFNIFPKLSFLTKFDLDKQNLNLFIIVIIISVKRAINVEIYKVPRSSSATQWIKITGMFCEGSITITEDQRVQYSGVRFYQG